jgi:hypothetical protein
MSLEIVVVANKWWEAAPLVGVLQNTEARPADFADVSQPGGAGPSAAAPRLTARCRDGRVAVWCIQDLMDADEDPALTWEKARVLPRVFRVHPAASLVLAFGTAACPQGSGHNGSVVIGSSVFVHDPFSSPPVPAKHWTHPRLNEVVESKGAALLASVSPEFTREAEKRFLTAPLVPASPPRIALGDKLVAVGVVNVTKIEDYKWADPQALGKFEKAAKGRVAASSETTHGVIRLASDLPFLYVSGLANALGKFAEEVVPRKYAQNFVAAHNAAVAAAWLIAALSALD